MKPQGPILTLFAGALLAGALLMANLNASGSDDAAEVTGAPAATGAAPPAPPATASGPATATAPAQPSAAAPGSAPATPPAALVNASWAGHVDGGGASVAIVVHQGVAIAYVCDGGRIEAWLKGTAAEGKLTLTGARKASLTGTFGNGRAEGTVRTGSRTWTFDVAAVKKPSGLYRSTQKVRSATIDAGWIVLADGTQVGVVTTDGAAPQPAPRLDTATGTATMDGSAVTATAIDAGTGSGF